MSKEREHRQAEKFIFSNQTKYKLKKEQNII